MYTRQCPVLVLIQSMLQTTNIRGGATKQQSTNSRGVGMQGRGGSEIYTVSIYLFGILLNDLDCFLNTNDVLHSGCYWYKVWQIRICS